MSLLRKVYLAHPYARKDEGKVIQTKLETLGVEVINPFERAEQVIYDRKIKPGSIATGLDGQDCIDIVEMDLKKIDESDAVVAFMPDGAPSIGTFMEVFYAGHVKHMPVISLAPSDRQAHHPWVRYYSTVVRTEEELLEQFRV